MCNSLTQQAVSWVAEDVLVLIENFADKIPTDDLAMLVKDVIHLESTINGQTGYNCEVVGDFVIGL